MIVTLKSHITGETLEIATGEYRKVSNRSGLAHYVIAENGEHTYTNRRGETTPVRDHDIIRLWQKGYTFVKSDNGLMNVAEYATDGYDLNIAAR